MIVHFTRIGKKASGLGIAEPPGTCTNADDRVFLGGE